MQSMIDKHIKQEIGFNREETKSMVRYMYIRNHGIEGLPSFSGDEKEDGAEWLELFEDYAMKNGWIDKSYEAKNDTLTEPEDQASKNSLLMEKLKEKLRGEARKWLETRDNQCISTWREFAQEFLEAFGGALHWTDAIKELALLDYEESGKGSAYVLGQRYLKLWRRTKYEDMGQELYISMYMARLPNEIQRKLVDNEYTDLKNLIMDAEECENESIPQSTGLREKGICRDVTGYTTERSAMQEPGFDGGNDEMSIQESTYTDLDKQFGHMHINEAVKLDLRGMARDVNVNVGRPSLDNYTRQPEDRYSFSNYTNKNDRKDVSAFEYSRGYPAKGYRNSPDMNDDDSRYHNRGVTSYTTRTYGQQGSSERGGLVGFYQNPQEKQKYKNRHATSNFSNHANRRDTGGSERGYSFLERNGSKRGTNPYFTESKNNYRQSSGPNGGGCINNSFNSESVHGANFGTRFSIDSEQKRTSIEENESMGPKRSNSGTDKSLFDHLNTRVFVKSASGAKNIMSGGIGGNSSSGSSRASTYFGTGNTKDVSMDFYNQQISLLVGASSGGDFRTTSTSRATFMNGTDRNSCDAFLFKNEDNNVKELTRELDGDKQKDLSANGPKYSNRSSSSSASSDTLYYSNSNRQQIPTFVNSNDGLVSQSTAVTLTKANENVEGRFGTNDSFSTDARKMSFVEGAEFPENTMICAFCKQIGHHIKTCPHPRCKASVLYPGNKNNSAHNRSQPLNRTNNSISNQYTLRKPSIHDRFNGSRFTDSLNMGTFNRNQPPPFIERSTSYY